MRDTPPVDVGSSAQPSGMRRPYPQLLGQQMNRTSHSDVGPHATLDAANPEHPTLSRIAPALFVKLGRRQETGYAASPPTPTVWDPIIGPSAIGSTPSVIHGKASSSEFPAAVPFNPSAPFNSSMMVNGALANATASMSSSSVTLFPSSNVTVSSSSPHSSTSILPSSSQAPTQSRSWTYIATPSKTTSGDAASQTTYVPGVVFNMTLGGTSDSQAVYSVAMAFGHEGGFRRRNSVRDSTYQELNMLVDLGSADMWAAVQSCTTSDCKASSNLLNSAKALSPDTEMPLTIPYAAGSVSGDIMWEQVTLGSFGIGYQAFLAADQVYNEDLEGGQFQGLLGLALPANSLITEAIPGTTGSNPDGATFLDNLFGAGALAPTERMFSLSFERREDSRTLSTFGIGTVDERLCPYPCDLNFIPIIPHANLGKTGYLHWRVPLLGIRAYSFSNPADGSGVSSKIIDLGPSLADSTQKNPLAVLDSGGVAILVASKAHADAIYGAYGISSSGTDGLYRMPCTQQLSFSFMIGDDEFPVHPLDMTWPDPKDGSQQTCIGAIQVNNKIADYGDLVLGSTFMKNVYSVFKYPDQKTSGQNWQPTIGLNPLINSTVASADFYAVRHQHKSLTAVSGAGGGLNPSSTTASTVADGASKHVVSTVVIAVCSVIGIFVVAAVAFCLWWFVLRRRVGKQGIIAYKMATPSDRHMSDNSMSTSRTRKHEETKRQKSIMDGFSDYDENSWQSYTHGRRDSAVTSVHEVHENDDRQHTTLRYREDSLSTHGRGASVHQNLLATDSEPSSPTNSDFYPPERHQSFGDIIRVADDPRSIDGRTNKDRYLRVDGQERRRSTDNRTIGSIDSRFSASSTTTYPDLERRSSSGATAIASSPSIGRLIDHGSPPASRSFPNLPAARRAAPRSPQMGSSHHSLSLSHTRSSPHSASLSMAGPFPTSSMHDVLTLPSPMSGPATSPRRLSTQHKDLDDYFPVLPTSESPTPQAKDRRRSSPGASLRLPH